MIFYKQKLQESINAVSARFENARFLLATLEQQVSQNLETEMHPPNSDFETPSLKFNIEEIHKKHRFEEAEKRLFEGLAFDFVGHCIS